MRIAIDVSSISAKAGRGFRRHVLTLLQALALNPEDNHFTILTNEPDFKFHLPPGDERFHCEPTRRKIPFCYRPGTGLLGRLFLREIDLVHFPCANIWASPRGKAVVTLHDVTPLRFPEKFFDSTSAKNKYHENLKRIAQRASRVITVSHYSQNDISRFLGIPKESISVIYNFPDARFYTNASPQLSEHLNTRIHGPYYIFVGGLDFRKNISMLLDAFNLYSLAGGRSKLVLVGRQNSNQPLLYPPLGPKLENHPLRNRILWLTDVNDDDLPALYKNAMALVFPSIAEGFGYPLVEAMASGTAVITVDTSCLKEISGKAALIAELSPDGIASAMVKIETDSALRKNLIELGLKRHKLFNAQTFSGQLISTYKALC